MEPDDREPARHPTVPSRITLSASVGRHQLPWGLQRGAFGAAGSHGPRQDSRRGGAWAQLALVQVEFVLGVALLWRPSIRVLRWAAMTLFAVFLAALVLMLREGRTSCGCGGGWIRVSPWVALGVDSWVVLLLAAGLAAESRLGSTPGPSCPVAAAGE